MVGSVPERGDVGDSKVGAIATGEHISMVERGEIATLPLLGAAGGAT
jgi:hypothetical protein